MKKIVFSLVVLLFTSCSTDKKQEEVLKQVLYSLEGQHKVSTIFNERNVPLFEVLKEAKMEKYKIDKSRFTVIDSLSKELNLEMEKSIERINQFKKKSSNTELYDATLEYLISLQKMETAVIPFLEKIKDTIKNNEESLALAVKTQVSKVKSKHENLIIVKSEYYEQNGIKQTEIDSIVEIIRTN